MPLAIGVGKADLVQSTMDDGRSDALEFLRQKFRGMPFATATLNIAFETGGLVNEDPVLLLHGWPDDVHTYDHVVPALHAAGFRTVAPYLRGFGDTSFLSQDMDTQRSGEIVAMAQDAIDLADALNLEAFAVIGHDWDARIAYVLAIDVPHRIKRMVTISVVVALESP